MVPTGPTPLITATGISHTHPPATAVPPANPRVNWTLWLMTTWNLELCSSWKVRGGRAWSCITTYPDLRIEASPPPHRRYHPPLSHDADCLNIKQASGSSIISSSQSSAEISRNVSPLRFQSPSIQLPAQGCTSHHLQIQKLIIINRPPSSPPRVDYTRSSML